MSEDFVVKCDSCDEELLFAKDSGTLEVVQFKIECVCGHENTRIFDGYPKLAGLDKYYFEFTDQYKVRCSFRHIPTKNTKTLKVKR